MTTIAYKDGILAADTLTSSHGRPFGHAKKVGRGPGGKYLYASAGDTAIGQAFRAWCAEGMTGTPPSMRRDDREAEGYVVFPDGTFSVYERDLPPTLLTMVRHHGWGYVWAAGSGSDIALGALHAGADARVAVEIAIQLDSHTGGGIDWVSFEDE